MDNQDKISYFGALSQSIIKANQQNNVVELRILLQQLAEAVSTPGDISCLIGPVVKLLPCHNLEVKKTIYSILPRICSAHPDTALLIANTLNRDIRDPNPTVKCLAITALVSIRPLHQDHASALLTVGLNDGNPKVRLASVVGCAKVHHTSPELIQDDGFVDRLYALIRDADPNVVSSCLIALDTILASEGGVVINRSIAWYLLKRLAEFPAPQLATVLQVLCKYLPDDEAEIFRELSALDPFLVFPSSAAVVVNCINLFLKLIAGGYPDLKHEVIRRSAPILKNFLSSNSSKETTMHVLDFLISMHEVDLDWLEPFSASPNLFYPGENADFNIALKQLQVLPYTCKEDNYNDILTVLRDKYCKHKHFGIHSMICVGIIAKRLDCARSVCLNVYIYLLDSNSSSVTDNVFHVIQGLDFSNFKQDDLNTLINKVYKNADFSSTSQFVPNILPQLMGHYGVKNKNSPFILELLAENFYLYDNELQLLTLTCAVRLFLQDPAKYQHSLGEIFDKCISQAEYLLKGNPSIELVEKAKRYYTFLKSNAHLMKKIFLENA